MRPNWAKCGLTEPNGGQKRPNEANSGTSEATVCVCTEESSEATGWWLRVSVVVSGGFWVVFALPYWFGPQFWPHPPDIDFWPPQWSHSGVLSGLTVVSSMTTVRPQCLLRGVQWGHGGATEESIEATVRARGVHWGHSGDTVEVQCKTVETRCPDPYHGYTTMPRRAPP